MGIVRREGKWRLDKQDNGVYEVTYKKNPELKIITEDYEPSGFADERDDFTIQTREVSSFSEAEQLFEKMADGEPSMSGFVLPTPNVASDPIGADLDSNGENALSDIPPAGLFFGGIIIGGYLIQRTGLAFESPTFLVGAGFLLLPIAVLGLTYRVYQKDGAGAAVEFLISSEDEDPSGTSTAAQNKEEDVEKTPPAPKKMKENIFFDRAEQRCEWCNERTNSPEIHHIEPRSEGGPNEYDNLIGLCPGCHSQADKGGISKTKLRSKVSRQMNEWDGPN